MLRLHFLLVVFGRLLTALIAVVSLRVMTTMLDPIEYGHWALLIAFQAFGSLFLINPVDQHVFRHAHAWWDRGVLLKQLKKYNQYILIVSCIVAVAASLWWHFTLDNVDVVKMQWVLTGLILGITLYFSTWNIALNYLLNMLGFRAQSVVWMVFSAFVGLACSTLFVAQYPHAISWISGQALGAIVGTFGVWYVLRINSKGKVDFSSIDEPTYFLSRSTILGFCLPLAAATGFMWLQNTGYRFWVGSVLGVSELAILVVGLGVATQLAAVVESLAMQFLYPYFARCIVDAKSISQTSTALSDLMNVLAPIYAIWAGFNAICASTLLNLLTDARYHIAVPYVIFGAMIEFMRCTTNLLSNTARAVCLTKGLILPYGFGAAVVWLGAICAASLSAGLAGLSLVLVFGAIVTCGSMMFFMQRLLPITLDIHRLAIGLIVMITCFVVAMTAPILTFGVFHNLAFLILSGIVTCFLMATLLWHNPALTRLLSVSLRVSE